MAEQPKSPASQESLVDYAWKSATAAGSYVMSWLTVVNGDERAKTADGAVDGPQEDADGEGGQHVLDKWNHGQKSATGDASKAPSRIALKTVEPHAVCLHAEPPTSSSTHRSQSFSASTLTATTRPESPSSRHSISISTATESPLAHQQLILGQSEADALMGCLPGRFQAHEHWHLLYATERDGYSLQTLLRSPSHSPSSVASAGGKAGAHPVLLVVRTLQGSRFGCFATEAWQAHLGHFGTGECFLFTLSPATSITGKGANDSSDLGCIFPAQAGTNDYYLFCDGTYIAAGIEDGAFGLWLERTLSKGTTASVSTFGKNPPLATVEAGANNAVGEVAFDIDAVELWALKTQ